MFARAFASDVSEAFLGKCEQNSVSRFESRSERYYECSSHLLSFNTEQLLISSYSGYFKHGGTLPAPAQSLKNARIYPLGGAGALLPLAQQRPPFPLLLTCLNTFGFFLPHSTIAFYYSKLCTPRISTTTSSSFIPPTPIHYLLVETHTSDFLPLPSYFSRTTPPLPSTLPTPI